MAGGKGGAKKLRRVSPAKSPAKPGGSATKGSATKARACSSAVAPAAEAAAESVPETLSMALDDKTAASITLQIKKQRGGKAGASSSSGGAVLYVGHIPHGFYEEQMKGFFSQFGDVKRLHLARNRKVRAHANSADASRAPLSARPPTQTGNSKHYAFVEFAHAEVAHIVAKAMHGYLMYSKVISPSPATGRCRQPRRASLTLACAGCLRRSWSARWFRPTRFTRTPSRIRASRFGWRTGSPARGSGTTRWSRAGLPLPHRPPSPFRRGACDGGGP